MMLPSASGRVREASAGEKTCSTTERASIRTPPSAARESEVTDMDEAGRHQERRREEAEQRRDAEKKRREQIRREKVENKARAFAAEQDLAINELISRARALTMDIEDFLMAMEDVLVTGESIKRGSEILATASRTILELHMVPGFNLDPLILSLRQAKVG
jgi:hypothetical protein